MAAVIVRIIDKQGAIPYLKRLPKIMVKEGRKAGWNITRKGAMNLKRQAQNAGIKNWRGILLSKNGIEARKLSTNRYGVFIPMYGVYLDSMRPHFVAIKRGRGITQWGEQKNVHPRYVQIGKKWIPGYFVRPHPYIQTAWRATLNGIDIELNRTANKIIRG